MPESIIVVSNTTANIKYSIYDGSLVVGNLNQLNVYFTYFRGLFRANRHFATVTIKLDGLESLATIHDSFDVSVSSY